MKSKKRGVSLLEAVTAAALTTIVIFGSVATFLSGMSAWVRGQAHIDAESGSQRAVRRIANDLREAMTVSVDADGMGITYNLPQKDGTGAYVIPMVSDGVSRRIALNAGQIVKTGGGENRVYCKGVVTTDPVSNAAYRVFTPGVGAVTRSLTIMIASRSASYKTETVASRSRETIYLRNIPRVSN